MEKRILELLLIRIDRGLPNWLASVWVLPILWLVLGVAFMTLSFFSRADDLSDIPLILISFFLGVFSGLFYAWRESEFSLRFILPHLTRGSVAKRLAELED